MKSREQIATKSVALARVQKIIGRTFSLAMFVSCIEVVTNALAFERLETHPLQAFALLVFMATLVGNFISFWFFDGGRFWYALQAIVVFIICITWVSVLDEAPDGLAKPWIWWAVGNATIAAILAFKPVVSVFFVFGLPAIWFWVRTSEQGGSATWQDAMQDSVYTFLFSLSISGLLILFQESARKADLENHRATLVAAERARVDAVESERARIDALVHDKVLTTLLVAANSKSPQEDAAATELAQAAIHSIGSLDESLAKPLEQITANSLFSALRDAVGRLHAGIQINIDNSSDLPIDARVAEALTEATLQAVNNSLLHAGTAVSRGLKMRTNGNRLKIVIYDTGRGFRVGRIPKSRLGLRLSIIDRVEKVGGRVFVDSRPGHGTNIILEWGEK